MTVELANQGTILAALQVPEEAEEVLSFAVERNGDTVMVKCHGRLIAGATEELTRAVKQLLPQARIVIVNLADLTQIDLTGLRTVAQLRTCARKADCRLSLLHLGKQLGKLLTLKNVLFVFSEVEEHGITIA